MKGRFITIEGPDGAGKSTQIELLARYLQDKGYEILITREPGGTRLSESIRAMILDHRNVEMASTTEALLYAASRAQHVEEKILPAIEAGKIVICDRFVHSSLVYQGIGRKLGIEKIKVINDFAIQGLKPDRTLFFNIDPERALTRKTSKSKGDRLEREALSFHKRVFEGYLQLVDMYPDEFKVIEADADIEGVFKQVKGVIEPLIED